MKHDHDDEPGYPGEDKDLSDALDALAKLIPIHLNCRCVLYSIDDRPTQLEWMIRLDVEFGETSPQLFHPVP